MSKEQIGTYGFCDVCGEPFTINGLCQKHQPQAMTPFEKEISEILKAYWNDDESDPSEAYTAIALAVERHVPEEHVPISTRGKVYHYSQGWNDYRTLMLEAINKNKEK